MHIYLDRAPLDSGKPSASGLWAHQAYYSDGNFCISIDGGTTAYLAPDQARQLRDEMTAFLGERIIVRPAAHDYSKRERDLASLRISRENEALRTQLTITQSNEAACNRDFDELTKQRDLYRAEAETLKAEIRVLRQKLETADDGAKLFHERSHYLADENEKLRQRVASLEKNNADLQKREVAFNAMILEAVEKYIIHK